MHNVDLLFSSKLLVGKAALQKKKKKMHLKPHIAHMIRCVNSLSVNGLHLPILIWNALNAQNKSSIYARLGALSVFSALLLNTP